VTRSGSVASWVNPSNAQTSNDARASITTPLYSGFTDYIRASDLADKLPTGAIIDGITITIERQDSANSTVDSSVLLVIDGASSGTNRADGSTSWPTSDTNANYGAVNDLWGLQSLTRDQANASGFGVQLSAAITGQTAVAP
jgi:hypothetical protein